MSNEYKRHPSYATLYIGRSYCSGQQTLFGSSIKHSDVITLKISPASISRNLNNDHIYSDTRPYIEIDMSQAQFAQAITSLNMRDGTPVTLKRLNGQFIEPCPFEDKRMQFDDEFSKDMKSLVQKFKDLSNKAEAILNNKKTLSKSDREEILSAFHNVQAELGSNLPFMYSQFNRQMEKTVVEAKAEVEGHIQARLNDMAMLGIQTDMLKEQMLAIGEVSMEYEDEQTEDEMQMGGM